MKIWDQKLILHDSSRFCLEQNDFNHSGPTVSRILAEIRRICGTTLRPVLEARALILQRFCCCGPIQRIRIWVKGKMNLQSPLVQFDGNLEESYRVLMPRLFGSIACVLLWFPYWFQNPTSWKPCQYRDVTKPQYHKRKSHIPRKIQKSFGISVRHTDVTIAVLGFYLRSILL